MISKRKMEEYVDYMDQLCNVKEGTICLQEAFEELDNASSKEVVLAWIKEVKKRYIS